MQLQGNKFAKKVALKKKAAGEQVDRPTNNGPTKLPTNRRTGGFIQMEATLPRTTSGSG